MSEGEMFKVVKSGKRQSLIFIKKKLGNVKLIRWLLSVKTLQENPQNMKDL